MTLITKQSEGKERHNRVNIGLGTQSRISQAEPFHSKMQALVVAYELRGANLIMLYAAQRVAMTHAVYIYMVLVMMIEDLREAVI